MFFAAAIQFHPQLGNLTENIQRLEEAVTQAASAGAKFIVTPELAVSGYMYETRESIFPSTDTIPGAITDRFHKLCLHWNVYLVLGMPEHDEATGLLYNAAALIGPEGYIGKYRKTHLWEAEAHWAVPGNLGFPVFQTELGNIAVNICMDAVYMESSRVPALNGADILAFPTNSSAQTISMLQGWATLNGMYIVSANRADEEKGFQMAGASAIWSPYGEKLVEAGTSLDGGEEEIIYGIIDPKHYYNPNRERLLKRRPELYKDVMLHIGPWNFRKSAEPKQVEVQSFTGIDLKEKASLHEYYCFWAGKISLMQDKRQQGIPALAVLPALSATGPVSAMSYEEIVLLGQTFAVEWLPKYQHLALALETSVVVSAPECAEGHIYLSAWLIDDKGEIVHVHRSTHLQEDEVKWEPGRKPAVATIEKIGRIGILFEEEAYFPEVTTGYGIQRIDVLALLAEADSDEEYPPLIDERFHANTNSKDTLKAVWENLAMNIQAFTAYAAWEKEDGSAFTAVYAVDPYYERDVTVSADAQGIASKSITTLREGSWYNQQHWIVSRRVDHYYPLVAEAASYAPMISPQEEDDMMA
ncbi:nitrilase-related carbon-nitrogen hydrolase [Alkalicoccus halolimnae]|uniref:Nitrilase-related carbon-nitrogen hydrolase n=1 Tax=Alkalicoccus halolimnae TaxID=1667239 RepID=A0A5C7F949_9BACI|nr:nitrilase-related carbon-nitrogen hydrolase [Alkalicoccus halolimnae]TXF85898.1 nitrilase [Alkalicoccus halolimnae]